MTPDNDPKSEGTVFAPAGFIRSMNREDGSGAQLVAALDAAGVQDGQLLVFKNGECKVAEEADLV